jgi:divalent metal cation (Fe/Co/Zn/Cd) transporter
VASVSSLTKEQAASRERTLLAALLLSAWAPLATGVAVAMSRSTTQLADFIRRTVELIVLFVSWYVFRQTAKTGGTGPEGRGARMERAASLSVAAALVCSGVILLALGLSRLHGFRPGGNVYPGLAIAGLGLLTNAWFWRRYTVLTREHFSPVIAVQRQLYSAKSLADLCVIAALSAVALWSGHPATRYVDALGSVAVAVYLVWSGIRAARTESGAARPDRAR